MLVPGGRLALSDLDSEDGTFHSAEAEGIHHLGFDRDGLVGAGPQRRLRRRRGALGDRHRGRGSPLSGLPAARPEPLTARRGPGILGPCTRIASRSPRRSAASGRFLWVVDWPGWCAPARTITLAIDALIEHGPRYAIVTRAAGLRAPRGDRPRPRHGRVPAGVSGTEFGVPSAITRARPAADRRRRRPSAWHGSSRRPGPSSTGWRRRRRRSCARARAAAAATATR